MMKTRIFLQRTLVCLVLLLAALAPAALAQTEGAPAPSSAEETADESTSWQNVQDELTEKWQYMPRFWGRMHPMLVHFPIGLIIAAGLLELLFTRRTQRASHSALVALGIGLFGTLLAGSSGWLNADLEPQSRAAVDTIFLHRWTGVATAGLALVSLVLGRMCLNRDSAGTLTMYRSALLLTCVGVVYGGHLGGSLVHGDGYLWSVFDEELEEAEPERVEPAATVPVEEPVAEEPEEGETEPAGTFPPEELPPIDPPDDESGPETASTSGSVPGATAGQTGDGDGDDPLAELLESTPAAEPVTVSDAPDYASEVRPIFEANCYRCHGERKQKGRLRLDRRADVFDGDEASWVIQPGRPDDSLVVQLISLPADSLDLMPAGADDEPLSAEEIDVIRRWIAAGAEWPESADDATPPEDAAGGEQARAGTSSDPESGSEGANAARAVAPTEPEPPEVAVALAQLDAQGVHALRIAETDPRIEVNLSLGGRDVGDAELAALKDLGGSLAWLNLGRTAVTDAGVGELVGRFPAIERLHLERTDVSDAALESIAGLRELSYLNLYGTAVSDDGLAHLAGLDGLRQLYLWDSDVTEEGVEQLQASLPECAIVFGGEELTLTDPPADDDEPQLPGCCQSAVDAGGACEHPCCVEAAAKDEICAQCS